MLPISTVFSHAREPKSLEQAEHILHANPKRYYIDYINCLSIANMAIRAEAYSSLPWLLPALFSTHPHLDEEIANRPAGCTQERYVRGAVLLHLERRSEACGVVGSAPFDPGTEGDRGDGCPADPEGSIDRCHRSRRAIWLTPATAARGSVEEVEMVLQKCETR